MLSFQPTVKMVHAKAWGLFIVGFFVFSIICPLKRLAASREMVLRDSLIGLNDTWTIMTIIGGKIYGISQSAADR